MKKNITLNMPKRIVILGSNSFIAKNLIKSLKKTNIKLILLNRKKCDFEKKSSIKILSELITAGDTIVFIAAFNKKIDSLVFFFRRSSNSILFYFLFYFCIFVWIYLKKQIMMEIGISQKFRVKMKTEIELLEKMLFIRIVEEKIAEKYIEQQMRCPIHLSIGQESSAVAVCHGLNTKDRVFSNHRCHAHYLAKNGNLEKMLGELYGKKIGCCKGRGGSMHLFDHLNGLPLSIPIVGSVLPIAVGSALQCKLDNKKIASVVFFGDGAAEEGIFHESLNFASLNKLPIIFVCENNLYSVYTNLRDRQPKRKITLLAESHKIKTYNFRSDDTLQIYKKLQNLIYKCRNNTGPFFVNIDTYRYYEHCGPNNDDFLNYRSKKEINIWKKRDPINFILNKLEKNKINFDVAKFRSEKIFYIEKVIKKVEKAPFPNETEVSKYLYAK